MAGNRVRLTDARLFAGLLLLEANVRAERLFWALLEQATAAKMTPAAQMRTLIASFSLISTARQAVGPAQQRSRSLSGLRRLGKARKASRLESSTWTRLRPAGGNGTLTAAGRGSFTSCPERGDLPR